MVEGPECAMRGDAYVVRAGNVCRADAALSGPSAMLALTWSRGPESYT